MSVRINPCHGCFVRHSGNTECAAIRAYFVRAVASIGLRSATFDCCVLAASIKPGARIVIRHPVSGTGYHYDGGEYESIEKKEVTATITSVKPGGLFACVVDKDQIDEDEEISPAVRDKNLIRFRKTMKHTRIVRFLDELPRKLCAAGNPILPSGECDNSGECWCGGSVQQEAAQ